MKKTCCFTVYYNFCKTFTSLENGMFLNVNLLKDKLQVYSSEVQRHQRKATE